MDLNDDIYVFTSNRFAIPKIMVIYVDVDTFDKLILLMDETGHIIEAYSTNLAEDGGNDQTFEISPKAIDLKIMARALDVDKIYCNMFPCLSVPSDSRTFLSKNNYYNCDFFTELLPNVKWLYQNYKTEKDLIVTKEILLKK